MIQGSCIYLYSKLVSIRYKGTHEYTLDEDDIANQTKDDNNSASIPKRKKPTK